MDKNNGINDIFNKIKLLILFSTPKVKKLIHSKYRQIWKNKFYILSKSSDSRKEELLNEFISCHMKKISKNHITKKNKYSPILICIVKDDLSRIKVFMKHYRKIGVEVFIFLDNNSTDGTREYLCSQKDTIVYESEQEYSSVRRVAWINRLLALYGNDRWCLIADSDELLSYIGMEEHDLTEVTKLAYQNGYFRIEGFMLDMYSRGELFNKDDNNLLHEYRYFDNNSYDIHGNNDLGVTIFGGPRKRIFHRNMQLSKYPMFYLRNNDFVASSHYMIPINSVSKCPIWFAICHYKFIDDKDLEKIADAVVKGQYAGGSEDYKAYMKTIKQDNTLSFYDKNESIEFVNSESLKNIEFLKNPFLS